MAMGKPRYYEFEHGKVGERNHKPLWVLGFNINRS